MTSETEKFRLRQFVERLVQQGECIVHDAPITLIDVGAVLEGNPKAVWFKDVGPEHAQLVGNVMGSRKRLAMSLDADEGTFAKVLRERVAVPHAPIEVPSAQAPVHQVVQIGAAESSDEREQGVVGELDSGKTHHESTSSIGVGSSRFRASPRRPVERRLPTNRFPSVFPAGQVAVETRNCLVPEFPWNRCAKRANHVHDGSYASSPRTLATCSWSSVARSSARAFVGGSSSPRRIDPVPVSPGRGCEHRGRTRFPNFSASTWSSIRRASSRTSRPGIGSPARYMAGTVRSLCRGLCGERRQKSRAYIGGGVTERQLKLREWLELPDAVVDVRRPGRGRISAPRAIC